MKICRYGKNNIKEGIPHHSTPKKSQAILKRVRQIPNFNLIFIFLYPFFLRGGGGGQGGDEREKYLSPEAAYTVLKNLRNVPTWPRETSGTVSRAVYALLCGYTGAWKPVVSGLTNESKGTVKDSQ